MKSPKNPTAFNSICNKILRKNCNDRSFFLNWKEFDLFSANKNKKSGCRQLTKDSDSIAFQHVFLSFFLCLIASYYIYIECLNFMHHIIFWQSLEKCWTLRNISLILLFCDNILMAVRVDRVFHSKYQLLLSYGSIDKCLFLSVYWC